MKLHVVTGQTGTGKTDYAIDLAHEIHGDIINADARQIYKKLDIVTGKDLELTDRIFHQVEVYGDFAIGYYTIKNLSVRIWLYDVVDPSSQFSAFDFKACALRAIENITQEGKTPVIVGGSYLYIKNLLYHTIDTHVPPNESLRRELGSSPVSELQNMLSKLDTSVWDKMNDSDRKNPHRLMRKIEILTFRTSKKHKHISLLNNPNFEATIEGFAYQDTHDLETVVRRRVQARIEIGAIQEVKHLLSEGYKVTDPGLNAIGYKQIFNYLENKTSVDTLVNEWTTKEVQYAKRQLTFMKENSQIVWKYR